MPGVCRVHLGCAGLSMAAEHQLPASGLCQPAPCGAQQLHGPDWQLKLTSHDLHRSLSAGPVWARAHSPAAAGTAASTPQQRRLPGAQQMGLLSVSHHNRSMALQSVGSQWARHSSGWPITSRQPTLAGTSLSVCNLPLIALAGHGSTGLGNHCCCRTGCDCSWVARTL